MREQLTARRGEPSAPPRISRSHPLKAGVSVRKPSRIETPPATPPRPRTLEPERRSHPRQRVAPGGTSRSVTSPCRFASRAPSGPTPAARAHTTARADQAPAPATAAAGWSRPGAEPARPRRCPAPRRPPTTAEVVGVRAIATAYDEVVDDALDPPQQPVRERNRSALGAHPQRRQTPGGPLLRQLRSRQPQARPRIGALRKRPVRRTRRLADLGTGTMTFVQAPFASQRLQRIEYDPIRSDWNSTAPSQSNPSAAISASCCPATPARTPARVDPPSGPGTASPPSGRTATPSSAVRRFPRCSVPVGLGAKRPSLTPRTATSRRPRPARRVRSRWRTAIRRRPATRPRPPGSSKRIPTLRRTVVVGGRLVDEVGDSAGTQNPWANRSGSTVGGLRRRRARTTPTRRTSATRGGGRRRRRGPTRARSGRACPDRGVSGSGDRARCRDGTGVVVLHERRRNAVLDPRVFTPVSMKKPRSSPCTAGWRRTSPSIRVGSRCMSGEGQGGVVERSSGHAEDRDQSARCPGPPTCSAYIFLAVRRVLALPAKDVASTSSTTSTRWRSIPRKSSPAARALVIDGRALRAGARLRGLPELEGRARRYRHHHRRLRSAPPRLEPASAPLSRSTRTRSSRRSPPTTSTSRIAARKVSRSDVEAAIEAIAGAAQKLLTAGTDQMAFFASYPPTC